MTQPESPEPAPYAGDPYRTPPTAIAACPLVIPYTGQARMQLDVHGGLAAARVRIDPHATALIRVDSDGDPVPRLRLAGDVVRLDWAASFGAWARLLFTGARSSVTVVLHPAVEWSFAIRGGLCDARFELGAGRFAGLDVAGGASEVELALPAPGRAAAIRIAGGALHVRIRRPADVGVSLALDGGIVDLRLDDQVFEAIGAGARLHGGGAPATPRYELAVAGGASGLAITRADG
jgi:hypothetical protein